MAIQPQQQITPETQAFQPIYDVNRTKSLIKLYKNNPEIYQEKVDVIRNHANYHNIPFYEGDFSILEAVQQAAGGFFEGFTTLRISDPPDNEYEAVARNIGHLAGFVPGILAGPLKALGLKQMAGAIGGLKSIPMLGADAVTKQAKKLIKPALKASQGGRFKAINTASDFMLADKAKHMAEGAFHLGVASSISSVWDGVDQMMHSFMGGAAAGGVFRGIGNIIPGTKTGDKAMRALAGSLFMGLPTTARGATTPEQIYEYLAGAYFGGKEQPWFRARAVKYLQKGEKLARSGDDPEFAVSRNPEKIEGFKKEPQLVKDEVNKIFTEGNVHLGGSFEGFGTESERKGMAYMEMKLHGILDQIPEAKEKPELGYKALHTVKYGKRTKTRKEAHPEINVATSGGAKGSDTYWARVMEPYGVHLIHNLVQSNKEMLKSYRERGVKGIERHIKDSDLYSVGYMVDKANRTLNRPISDKNFKFFLRNAHQVKNAQSVFAIGEIETANKRTHLNGKTVKGGTGWAVQMGIDKGLEKIYVFDPTHRVSTNKQGAWFQYNYGVGRFTPISKAPKLTRNPALIGTRGDIKWRGTDGKWNEKLSKQAKEAMHDVAEATFGEKVITKGKAKIKGFHRKTAQSLNKINTEIQKREAQIKEINEAIKEKPDKLRIKELKEHLKTVKEELRLYEKERKENVILSESQYKNEAGTIVNDSDVGMKASDFPLMKRGEHFASEHLSELWKGSENVRNNILNYGITVERILRENIQLGNKNVRDKEVVDEIISTLSQGRAEKIKISEDGANQIKRWLRELNLGEQVTYVQTLDGKKIKFTKKARPVSLSGKPLTQLEAPKLIQEVYKTEGGKLKKGEESSVVIFDSIAKYNKQGRLNDIDLGKLEDFFKYQTNSKNPEKSAREIKKKVIGNMEKEGYYPLGGQADKGRIVFVKHHPKTQKSSKTKIDKDLRIVKKELKKLDKKSTTLLSADKRKAKTEYGITPKQFDKMLHSNVMYDLSLNGLKETPGNIKTVMGGGFVPSAIGYNKRAQIWMSAGYGGNKEFIKNEVKDLSNDGNFKYIIIDEPKKFTGNVAKALNIKLPEHVDGAIIVRDDVINAVNKDAGHPKSGQNKSFIIDPNSKHGALLGKYMMHTAGPEATEAMKKQDIHMLMMGSATKQTGTRGKVKYSNWKVGKNGELSWTGGERLELDPGNIRYSDSVINDSHMAQKQIWVKQLFTNLHQFGHKKIDKSVIDDIHETIIQKKYDGDTSEGGMNQKLAEYIKTLNSSKIEHLVENLESIGTNDLTTALRTPGAELFAEKALQKMLRTVETNIEAEFRAGEMTAKERSESLKSLQTEIGPIDKLLRNVAIVGEEMALKGETGYAGYMHKYVSSYKAAILHNYFVKSITRPVVDNSAVARMRPYDKWMQKDFKELNTRDDIFYLDSAYEKTIIKKLDGSNTTLGKLWARYNDKKVNLSPAEKEFAESVFEAVVLRVPMDSISGAHKLKFKGFTGREGHGIMLNSKVMRALGGADLDGDEAFIYFGGRKESGEGFGMKKSWKNAIHDQKLEFVDPKTKDYKDNKADFRKELSEGADPNHPMKKSKALYYSPYSRLKASEGAVKGRNMLGVAVSQGQVMKSMYSSLMEAKGKEEKFEIRLKNPKTKKFETFTVVRTPKESKTDRKRQREMTRAQIAFASDPLDEVGLKNIDVFFQKLHDSYFNVKVLNAKGKEALGLNVPYSKLKGGMYKAYKNMNRAYFGKNYEANRRYTMDEVNHLAGDVNQLEMIQQNTILPKMVNTLQGTNWGDNLYHRIAGETGLDKSNTLKALYENINKIAKEDVNWVKKAMGRVTFEVPYNDHIKAVIKNKLYNRSDREAIAGDIPRFLKAIEGTTFGKQLTSKYQTNKFKKFPDRVKALEEISMLGEHYLANDLADMATLINIKRILDVSKGTKQLNERRIDLIMRRVDDLKARSYLNMKERRELDHSAYTEGEQGRIAAEFVDLVRKELGYKVKKSDLAGDKRSAMWDQAQIDSKIAEYKSKLRNDTERELFDHLMIGTYRRGNLAKLQRLIDKIPNEKYNPIFNDVIKELVDEVSATKLSRLGYNSQEVNDKAIRDHLRAMSEAFGKTWKTPTKEEIDAETKALEKIAEENKIGEKSEVDAQVEKALANEAYAGIKKTEITRADKDLMVRLAANLKKHNNKMGDNLNEVLGGILDKMGEAPKDLNAMNRQDYRAINRYLEEVESGSIFQKLFGKKGAPELQKRYYWLFPNSVNRELMAYDIEWIKKEGFFLTKDGDSRPGTIQRPTYYLEIMQNWIHKANDMATGKATDQATLIEKEFQNLKELKEGDFLFEVGVYEREIANKNRIAGSKEAATIKKAQRLNYDISLKDTEKEFGLKWKDVQKQKFTVTNDNGNRVSATGRDIVRGNSSLGLEGIKNKQTKLFKGWYKIISGNKDVFDKYRGEGFFDEAKTQPIMNWRKFVKDIAQALEKGDNIPMDIGIDGMRHISRSMLVDLHGPKFKDIEIFNTGDLSEMYWPHMFFSKKSANSSMKETIKRIKEDGSMTKEEKDNAIRRALVRHKSLSGDWEYQDMQDFDRIDIMNIEQGLKDIAKLKKQRKEKIHWTDADIKFGSMFSRTGHEGGWSKDVSVMNAYAKNLTSTFYRQMSQIMTNKVIHDANTRMSSKFGFELANKWQKYFKLYAQGAMGNPDVIPSEVYNDPAMKIKGTPYAWFADSTVLDRVNKMREKLGIKKSDLPKELQEFTYKDIRDWSNLEAKFELMSLLAHPKSAVTNIFGGSIHTIQSAGIPALKKARDIKFLKRINPEWNTLEDVTKWVIKKGVVPEFLVHELGLGKNVENANVQRFVGDLASQLNSNEPISKKELFSLGRKHGLSSKVVNLASKFMSVPERILRRDAFMAHYIRAWERFGGTIKDPNHPFLIEMAKKGVKATQFLYEAPFRPFFARTALGKVMSRFQLFAWNSFRFRNDIIRQAKRYGFRPGTEAFERYRRTMTADLFVVALANMFAFSLFDNALPSPWNWFQDTSEWLFGDEKERNKAFFGMYPSKIAPLQIVTPPIARFPVSGLRQWIDDDYSKFSDYYVWTMFPFGRLGRDVFQKDQGLIDNPMRIMEKFTGMPVMDLARQKKKKEKAMEEGTRYKQPKVGF